MFLKRLLIKFNSFVWFNIELLTCIGLFSCVAYLFRELTGALDDKTAMLAFVVCGMSLLLGMFFTMAIYGKKVTALKEDQVKREVEMLERFRGTISDLMKLK